MQNYNLLVFSDDGGKSWSEPLLIIPSSYEMNVHALDIQIYIDRVGALHVCWVQNNTLEQSKHPEIDGFTVDGYIFCDSRHAEWEIVCAEPDAAEPNLTRLWHTRERTEVYACLPAP